MNMKIKTYAVINKFWKDKEWDNPIYGPVINVRGSGPIQSLAIFEKKYQAKIFMENGKNDGDEIIEIYIDINI